MTFRVDVHTDMRTRFRPYHYRCMHPPLDYRGVSAIQRRSSRCSQCPSCEGYFWLFIWWILLALQMTYGKWMTARP
jgi:hypothetical protein